MGLRILSTSCCTDILTRIYGILVIVGMGAAILAVELRNANKVADLRDVV